MLYVIIKTDFKNTVGTNPEEEILLPPKFSSLSKTQNSKSDFKLSFLPLCPNKLWV